MNRAVIMLCAGTSSRFSKSLNQDVLKMIYHGGNPLKTILAYQLNSLKAAFNKIVIVGGYRIRELQEYVSQYFPHLKHIQIVINPYYKEYGTGYSFLVGLNALQENYDEVVLLEGDLILDHASFEHVILSMNDVITATPHLIDAQTSVVFYCTPDEQLKYVYSRDHSLISIPEPFITLGNSGQVWKFKNMIRLVNASSEVDFASCTKLQIVEKYFEKMKPDIYEVVTFKNWINCNTLIEYQKHFWE